MGESRLILLHTEYVSLPQESKRTFSSLYCAKIPFSSHGLAVFLVPSYFTAVSWPLCLKTGPFPTECHFSPKREFICVNTIQQCWNFLIYCSCHIKLGKESRQGDVLCVLYFHKRQRKNIICTDITQWKPLSVLVNCFRGACKMHIPNVICSL